MIIRKAYKFKLKPTSCQKEKLAQMAGSCRYIWNKALAMNLERLEEKQKLIWYNELAFWLTFWKKTDELSFLKKCHSQPLQQTLKNLDRAFKDAFDKTQPLKKIPVFKRKWKGDSLSFPQGFKFQNKRVFLPKIGWVKFFKSRGINGKPKNLTVKKAVDGWYISVQVEIEENAPVHTSNSMVGIDMGVVSFATLSNGEFFQPLNSFRKHEIKLLKAQRKLARQKKFSNKWRAQKRKIGKIHHKVRNCRMDYLHKTSSKISKNHAIVVLEDLDVKNMSKSGKGSLEKPGKNVSIKSTLNKSILDQGWGKFRELLTYKLSWLGGETIFVDPKYTSQKCPNCSNIDPKNRLTQSEFACKKCDYKNNADIVGAKNILAAGLAVMACQANSLRSRQQEPVGNRKKVLSRAL